MCLSERCYDRIIEKRNKCKVRVMRMLHVCTCIYVESRRETYRHESWRDIFVFCRGIRCCCHDAAHQRGDGHYGHHRGRCSIGRCHFEINALIDVDANCGRKFAQRSARLSVSVESSQMYAKCQSSAGESESDVSKTDLIGMDRLNGRS